MSELWKNKTVIISRCTVWMWKQMKALVLSKCWEILAHNTMPHPRRLGSSTIPLWESHIWQVSAKFYKNTRVNQKVKAIFKLHSNRDREELPYCAVLTVPVEEFSHVQYSALPSVEWQQRGRKCGHSFARSHHRRTTWRSAVSLGRRSETCGNSLLYVGSVWTEHHESKKGLWVGGKV